MDLVRGIDVQAAGDRVARVVYKLRVCCAFQELEHSNSISHQKEIFECDTTNQSKTKGRRRSMKAMKASRSKRNVMKVMKKAVKTKNGKTPAYWVGRLACTVGRSSRTWSVKPLAQKASAGGTPETASEMRPVLAKHCRQSTMLASDASPGVKSAASSQQRLRPHGAVHLKRQYVLLCGASPRQI